MALFLACATGAFAEAVIQFGPVYQCHRDGGKIRVVDCADASCHVFYINPYSPGGGFTTQMSEASVHGMIDGNPAQCSIGGAAANLQAPDAPAPNVPVKVQPAAQPAAQPVVPGVPRPNYKPPASGGGITLAAYECYTYSGGRLNSALSENFTLVDNARYTDAAGHSGTYAYNAGTGKILFTGAALGGQSAKFRAGVQPFKNHPPTVTFPLRDGSDGDSCDAQVK